MKTRHERRLDFLEDLLDEAVVWEEEGAKRDNAYLVGVGNGFKRSIMELIRFEKSLNNEQIDDYSRDPARD